MQITGISQDTLGNLLLTTKAGLSRFNGESFDNYEDVDCLPDFPIHAVRATDGNIYVLEPKNLIQFDGDTCDYVPLPEDLRVEIASMIIEYIPGLFIIGKVDSHRRKPYFYKDGEFYPFSEVLPGYRHDRAWGYARTNDTLYVASPERDSVFVYHELRCIDTITTDLFAFFNTNRMDGGFLNFPAFFRRVGGGLGGYEMFRIYPDGHLEHNCAFTDPLEHGQVPCRYPHDVYRRPNTLHVDLAMPYQQEMLRIEEPDEQWGVLWAINRSPDGSRIFQGERGLSMLDEELFFTIPEEKLPGIWTVIENDKGEMLFGGYLKGIYKQKGKDDFLPQPIKDVQGLYGNNSDPLKSLYFGASKLNGHTYWPTAYGYIKEDGGNFLAIYDPDPSKRFSTISSYADTESNLLVLSACDGVRFYDPVTTDTIRVIPKKRLQAYACALEATRDHQGDYWFVYKPHVARYNFEEDSLRIYEPEIPFISVEEDAEGRLWFGSRKGLYYYDQTEDKLKKYPVFQNVFISALQSYSKDKMFASAGNEVVMFNPSAYFRDSTVQYKKYNESNGYLGIEPNQTGLYLDSQDRLWITSATVLTYTYPGLLHYSDYQLTPRITHIDGQRLPLDQSNIRLDRGKTKISIDYEAIGLERPLHVQYSYRLDEGDWSPYSENKTAWLTDLSSGKHSIELRVRGDDKTDFPIGRASFVADVPLFKEPYFPKLLMLTSFLLVIALVSLSSILRINRKQKELIQLNLENIKSQNKELIRQVEEYESRTNYTSEERLPENMELTVSLLGHSRDLPLNSLVYLKAARNYVDIYTTDDNKPLMPRGSLKAFSKELLPSRVFVQVHRSYIVNLQHVRRVNGAFLELDWQGQVIEIPVGPTYTKNLSRAKKKETSSGVNP